MTRKLWGAAVLLLATSRTSLALLKNCLELPSLIALTTSSADLLEKARDSNLSILLIWVLRYWIANPALTQACKLEKMENPHKLDYLHLNGLPDHMPKAAQREAFSNLLNSLRSSSSSNPRFHRLI